jgi:hypothetical protein
MSKLMGHMSTYLINLNQVRHSTFEVIEATPYRDRVEERRLLAGAGTPDDDGAADPGLAAALAAYDADPAREPEVLEALAGARLLVPVVAVLAKGEQSTGTGPDEEGSDKSSDMATVLMRGADGRLALLAFTGLEALHRWDPAARPVPVPARTAGLAALQDGAEALLLDVAGPVRYVVEIST